MLEPLTLNLSQMWRTLTFRALTFFLVLCLPSVRRDVAIIKIPLGGAAQPDFQRHGWLEA